jgi:hypothetical protein
LPSDALELYSSDKDRDEFPTLLNSGLINRCSIMGMISGSHQYASYIPEHLWAVD